MTRGCLAVALVVCVTLCAFRVAWCVSIAVVALYALSSVSSFSVEWSVLRMGGIDLILEWCCLAPLAVVPGRAAPLGVEYISGSQD